MRFKYYILLGVIFFAMAYVGAFCANLTCYWQEDRIDSFFGKNKNDDHTSTTGTTSNNDFMPQFEFFEGSMISTEALSIMPTSNQLRKTTKKNIFIPLSVPVNKHQFLRKEAQRYFAEKNDSFLRSDRWEEEANIVIANLEKYDCLKSNSKIVDLGAGHGFYSLIFSQLADKGFVYCCDINPAAQYESAQSIRYNQINNNGARYSNIVLWLNTPDSTLLEKESVDLIFARDVHFVHEGTPEKDQKMVLWDRENVNRYRGGLILAIKNQHGSMLQSIYNTLKPGGHFVLLERMCGVGMSQRLDRQGIVELLTSYGFKQVADIRDLEKTEKNREKLENGEIDHFLIFKK